jgi:aerobic-type carbon monoxide dehydrogenase small subunit (CoxS/CutS family)
MSKIKVNGQEHTVLADSQTSLLEVLQNELTLS